MLGAWAKMFPEIAVANSNKYLLKILMSRKKGCSINSVREHRSINHAIFGAMALDEILYDAVFQCLLFFRISSVAMLSGIFAWIFA